MPKCKNISCGDDDPANFNNSVNYCAKCSKIRNLRKRKNKKKGHTLSLKEQNSEMETAQKNVKSGIDLLCKSQHLSSMTQSNLNNRHEDCLNMLSKGINEQNACAKAMSTLNNASIGSIDSMEGCVAVTKSAEERLQSLKDLICELQKREESIDKKLRLLDNKNNEMKKREANLKDTVVIIEGIYQGFDQKILDFRKEIRGKLVPNDPIITQCDNMDDTNRKFKNILNDV